VAYQAEIQIGVRGAHQLKELQEAVDKLSIDIDEVNKKKFFGTTQVANLKNYNNVLKETASNLQSARITLTAAGEASGRYATAIDQYVTALGRSNQAQAVTNDLVQKEIKLRQEAARVAKLQADGIQEVTQYEGPIGPGPASAIDAPVRKGVEGVVASPIDPSRGVAIQRDQLALEQALLQLKERRADAVFEELKNSEALVRSANEAKLIASEAAGIRPQSQLNLPSPARRIKEESRARAEQLAQESIARGRAAQEEYALRRENLSKVADFARQNEARVFGVRAKGIRRQLDLEFERIMKTTKEEIDQDKKVFKKLIDEDKKAYSSWKARLDERERESIKSNRKVANDQRKQDEARRRRLKDITGSALIGGAFPLLFGQGAGAAAGGGIGGALGGVIGGQMGFALSLVGTQFGTFADQIVSGAATLGQALDPLTADLEALAEAAGYAGTETQAAIEVIRELGSEQQALEAATALLAVTVGNQGVVALQEFGENTADLGREFSRTMSLMQAAAAAMFSGIARMAANILERANDLSAGLKSDDPELVKLRQRREELLDTGRPSFGGSGAQTSARRTVNLSTEQRKELLAIEEKIRAVVRDKRLGIEQQTKAIAEQLQTTKFLNQFGIKNAALTATELKLASQKRDLTNSEYVSLLKLKAEQELQLRNKKAEEAIDKNKLEFLKTNGSLQQVQNKNLEDFKNKIAQIDRDSEAAIDRKNKKEASAANRANKQSEREIAAQRRILQAAEDAVAVQQNKLDLARAEGTAAKALLQFAVRKTQIEQKFAKQVKAAQKAGGPSAAEAISNIEKAKGLALSENQVRLDNEIKKISEDTLKPLNDKIRAYEDQITFNETYRKLIKEGINPELAKELANIDLIYEKSLDKLDAEINSIEALKLQNKLNEDQIAQLDSLIEKRGALETKRSEAKTAATAADAAQPGKVQAYVDQLQQELNDTEGMIVSLAQTVENEIGSAMSSAITGVITGTQTVEEAMSTMFANIGKAFVDMATQMIAKALVMKALGILSGGLGGGGGEGFGVPVLTSGTNFFRANGGPVRPNGTYMVGEQGPELLTMGNQSGFVHSNTSEAMDRYRAGGSSGGGGSLNVNYNVTQINGMNFVTEEQFRAGMTQAAKDGAKMGEAGTFKTMRNSRSSRARVGL